MRIQSALFSLLLGVSVHAVAAAQAPPPRGFFNRSDIGLTYSYVHSETVGFNTGTSTFALSGVGASLGYALRPHLAAVLDFDGTHVNGIENTGSSLTMLTYLAGPRYTFRSFRRASPYALVALGGVHATGGAYPPTAATGGGADTFAMNAGVGADYPLNSNVSLRAQAAYLYTALPNGSTNRQSDLRLDAGFSFRFGSR